MQCPVCSLIRESKESIFFNFVNDHDEEVLHATTLDILGPSVEVIMSDFIFGWMYSYCHLSVISTKKNPFIECMIP